MSALELPSTERPDRRWVAVFASLSVHALILSALLAGRETVPTPLPKATPVVLVEEPPRVPDATPAPATTKPAKTSQPKSQKPVEPPAPSRLSSQPSNEATATGPGDVLSGAALGSAASAETLPGGDCNMARRLQGALRRDGLVRAAVSARGLTGAAILVWNGGWVTSPGEDGKGLAAVREALVWEVAFAPAACRAERVHGPVLFSIGEGQTSIAVGAGDWRWSDLVSSR